jgi:type I restriction enzyme S subunit
MNKEPIRFKQTEIGELPEEWEVVKLGDVFNERKESINPQQYPNEIFELYSIPAYDQNHEPQLLEGKTIGSQKLIFEAPAILLSRLNPHNFRIWLVSQQSNYRKLASTEFIILKANNNINILFGYYLCFSSIIRQKIQNLAEGTTGSRKRVAPKDILSILIPLPPPEEQKRIAGVLRLVDRVAEETRRIVSIYERAKRFALKRLLTRGIGHTRFKQTEIGELPEGWEVKKLGEIATIKQGGRLGLTKKDYVPEGYPAFSATGQDGYVPVYEYEGEAIILSSIGAQCGKCFYATGKWTTLANTQIIFVNPEIANTLFIFYQVNRPNFWVRLGSAQPFIRPSDVKNAKVIIPPLEEQKQIVEMLSTIDAAIENERRYLGVLEKCKRWLLDNLLTGKIRLSPEVDEILKGVLPDAF